MKFSVFKALGLSTQKDRHRTQLNSVGKVLSSEFPVIHRITESLGLEWTSGDHPVQPSAKAGLPRAGYTGMLPGGF